MSSSGSSTSDSGASGVCLPGPGASAQDEPEQADGLAILDLTVLRELEEDMGSGVARAFAKDYIGIWEKRLAYLQQSIAENDPELAMDAVLSLKNSAFMVGGSRLASLAVESERLIRAADLPSVRELLPVIAQTGAQTVAALKRSYLRGH